MDKIQKIVTSEVLKIDSYLSIGEPAMEIFTIRRRVVNG